MFLRVKENGPIEIDESTIIDETGTIHIKQEVLEKGLVEIITKRGKLVIKAGNKVGRFEIIDGVYVEVVPKTPVKNIMHMISTCNQDIKYLDYYTRLYGLSPINSDSLFEHICLSLLRFLKILVTEGLFKVYEKRQEFGPNVTGKLNISTSIKKSLGFKLYSGIAYEKYIYNVDNEPNRLIKNTLVLCLTELNQLKNIILVQEFKEIFDYFENVQLVGKEYLSKVDTGFYTSDSFSPLRGYYIDVCNLCLVIQRGASLDFDSEGHSFNAHSHILDVASLFESYMFSIFHEKFSDNDEIKVLDGNSDGMKPLFSNTEKYKAKPDYVFIKNGHTKLIADAKYKMKISEHDRYQVISYAVSFGIQNALIICPMPAGKTSRLELIGEIENKGNSIKIFYYFIDIGNQDLKREEENLINVIQDLM
jgi:5-methylcytosine-specific restriction enzyme subunit McrC